MPRIRGRLGAVGHARDHGRVDPALARDRGKAAAVRNGDEAGERGHVHAVHRTRGGPAEIVGACGMRVALPAGGTLPGPVGLSEHDASAAVSAAVASARAGVALRMA